MKTLTDNKLLKFFSLFGLVLAVQFSNVAVASEHETACKAHIQGKIAWDPASNYASASKWEEKNLAYLCKGTTSPKAPGECFHHVMNSHVSHGDSDKWDYENAMELCKGSNDADATVNCFKGQIKDKVDWKTAISQCQAKKSLENVAE
jgi:hypothetical protein